MPSPDRDPPVPPVSSEASTDRSYAHLDMQSDVLDPRELTELIGLKADRTSLRGERSRNRQILPRHNIWDIRSRLDGSQPLDAHVRDLLDRLDGHAAEIRALAHDPRVLSIRLSLVQEITSWNPGVFLDAETIARVAQFGIGLDIDIYVDLPEPAVAGEPLDTGPAPDRPVAE